MCGCIGVAEEGTRRYVLLLRITLAERRGHEVIINIYIHTPLFIYSTCDVKKIIVFLAPKKQQRQPRPATNPIRTANPPSESGMALSLSPPAAAAACSSTSVFLRPTAVSLTMSLSRRRQRSGGSVVAMADLLGDLGARDPFPEEIESKFGEKVLGNVDTLHQILIPTLSALSLARLPLQPDAEPLSLDDARRLLLKVVGWRLVLSGPGGEEEQWPERLQCVWKVRDEACGLELIARINAALDGAGHAPAALVLEAPDSQAQVRAELSTPSAAGDSLTVNDYIVAARIDKVKTLDLIPKKRVWA